MAFGRRLVARAVCVPLLLVGGCADDPEPKLAPPDDTPTSASSSPSASPTLQPWEKKTNAGAVAFAKHWIDVFNEAKGSGNVEELRRLSEQGCESCNNFVSYLDDLYRQGGRFESEGWTVRQATTTLGIAQASKPRVAMRIHQSPEKVHSGQSDEIERFPGGMVSYSATLTWTRAGWLMYRLDLVS